VSYEDAGRTLVLVPGPAPEIFVILEDGIAYVRDGMDIGNDPGGAGSMVPVAPDYQSAVVASAEDCPGECIFVEVSGSGGR
jgi:ferredoxin